MSKKSLTWTTLLLPLLCFSPPFPAFASPIYYDYVGSTGQLDGTYSGFIKFNSSFTGSFSFSDIVDSQINYTNSSLALTGFWPHSDLISGGGTISGTLIEQFDLDWCCTSGDTNTSAGSTPIWAVSLGPFSPDDSFVTDVGTGGWIARETMTPVPEPSSLLLMGSGLVAIGFYVWLRRRRQQIIEVAAQP